MKSLMIFAHRGASHIYPENTLPAFREAIRRGANGLELDVHLTKDGYPVVVHDEHLNRTTTGKGLVKNYTLKEIKELSAGSWFDSRYSHFKVPTLEEVFEKAQSYPVLLNIEIKNVLIRYDNIEKEIIRLIKKYDFLQRVILSSFNPESIKLIHSIESRISTGLLYFGKLADPWVMAHEFGAKVIQPPIDAINPHFVQNCRHSGLLVCPYNVNQWREIVRAVESGVDGMVTLYPERVRKFVE